MKKLDVGKSSKLKVSEKYMFYNRYKFVIYEN
jgi:hypothetical protein